MSLGEKTQTNQQQLDSTEQQSSAIRSLLGNVRLWDKQDCKVLGSHLIAPQMDALKCNPQQLGGINVTTTFGSSESHSESSEHHTAAQRSLVVGRNVRIQALSGDATIQGEVQAQELARITAAGDLKLLASENRGQQESSQSSSSHSFGVGRGIVVEMTEGECSGQGESCRYQLAQVHAGQKVELESGGDTLVQGVVSAPQIQEHIDTGRIIGTKGQTGIRIIIGSEGKLWNAFPVNIQ